MQDNTTISNMIFDKVKGLLPSKDFYNNKTVWHPKEINERFRYLKYEKGEFFKKHCDGSYWRPRSHKRYGDQSFLTIIIYLNEGHDGATAFYSGDEE